ncbi:MAG: GH3 auxin-responsive promoter family protein, partial [Deltaproteobacteria bacterium]|nr:GH3 auxin-responsive promoter family protein [Deltaproteobacteria bacterium]
MLPDASPTCKMRVMRAAVLVHLLHCASQFPEHARFVRALRDAESAQRAVLARLLALLEQTDFGREHGLSRSWTAEDVAARLPVSAWSDWVPRVERQRTEPSRWVMAPRCTRFEPTSGSTSRRKWIPYSEAFLSELDRASSPWLFDLGRSHPGILKGRHYWSLSWLPDELRGASGGRAAAGDDLQLLPWWKRRLLGRVMAVSPDVARLPSVNETLFETLVALSAAADLSLVSVWSPTFALELLRRLGDERQRISVRLDRLGAGRRASLLRSWDGIPSGEFYRSFWPRLSLVSAWDTGSSASWAACLSALLPQAAFQGKGVWATEGVVTIPFCGHYPLAVRSHFYEFRCLETGRIVPSWRLEPDMEVQPILSTGSGLWRYALEDRLRVTGFLESTPCLEFVARLSGTDLVGEKLDAALAQRVLDAVQCELAVPAASAGRENARAGLRSPDGAVGRGRRGDAEAGLLCVALLAP